VVSSIALLSLMHFTFSCGHIYYALFMICCGFKGYFELVNLSYHDERVGRSLLATMLDYFIPLGFLFYLLPKTFIRRILIDNDSLFDFKNETPLVYNILFVHHSLISGILLLFGFVLFTLSLEKGKYKHQFKKLGWQIVVTIPCISSGMFLGYYTYKGNFWLIMTNGSVCINDVMAYVFGKLFGRTQLTKLSPNKTVEGFVGGGISTILFAVYLSGYLSHSPQLTCPQEEITLVPFKPLSCERPAIYDPREYSLPFFVPGLGFTINLAPSQLHAAVIALFSALVAPFGGFFASGLKRSLKIKDFADSIPGHGGVADRFDCHIVVAFFAYIYLTQVVYKNTYGIERIFDYI